MTMRGPLAPPVPPSCPCPIPRAVRRGAGRPRRAAVGLGHLHRRRGFLRALGRSRRDRARRLHPAVRPHPPARSGRSASWASTAGGPFTVNPCFAAEYAVGEAAPGGGGRVHQHRQPGAAQRLLLARSGSRDPALCRDSTSTRDPGCAYNYGWHAAAEAAGRGRPRRPGAAQPHLVARRRDGQQLERRRDRQHRRSPGRVDLLRSKGVARVGLYSTAYQWRTITGGYTASSAARYRTAWRPAFTPRYRLEAAPLWIATAGDAAARQDRLRDELHRRCPRRWSSSSTAAASTRTTSVEGLSGHDPGSRRPARRRSSRTRAEEAGRRRIRAREQADALARVDEQPPTRADEVGCDATGGARPAGPPREGGASRALPWTAAPAPAGLERADGVDRVAARTVVGCHVPSVSVVVTTYLGSAFIRSVNGSSGSVICGQSRANAS